jgi:hypothetical protein
LKNTVISDDHGRIRYLGDTVAGSVHDYSLLKEELPPGVDWFEDIEIWLDLGYQGIKTDYSFPENIHIPHKKPRKSKTNPEPKLSRKQKKENREIGKVRVVVEHAIGGMKRFNILTTKFRNKIKNFANDVILVASGLWNIKFSHLQTMG